MAEVSSTAGKAATPKKRKSGVIVPNTPKWHQRLGAWILWAGFTLISATLRYRTNDPHGFMVRKDFGHAIYCIWHNRLALSMKLYFAFGIKRHQTAGLAGLVSASRDGAFLAAVLERFGVQPVRGSSSRRGAQALLELTTWAERGYDLAITPDGPRGPRYVVQDGAMALAQITGLPIVPVFIENMQLVSTKNGKFHPFGGLRKVEVHYGEPIAPEKYLALPREEFLELVRQKITMVRQPQPTAHSSPVPHRA